MSPASMPGASDAALQTQLNTHVGAAANVHNIPNTAVLLRQNLAVGDVEVLKVAAFEQINLAPFKVRCQGQVSGRLYATNAGNPGQLYYSTDNAVSWTTVSPGLGALDHVFETASGAVLVASRAGALDGSQTTLYRSTDLTTWTSVFAFQGSANWTRLYLATSLCQLPDGTLLLGEYGSNSSNSPMSIYKSTDDGATWQVAHTWTDIRHVHTVQADPFVLNRSWATIGDSLSQSRIAYSDDHWATFTYVAQNTYPQARAVGLIFTPTQVLWGSDTPELPAQIYSWSRATQTITGPVATYDGATLVALPSSNGVALLAHTIEPAFNRGVTDSFRVIASADGAVWSTTSFKWRGSQVNTGSNRSVYGFTQPLNNVQSVSLSGGATGGTILISLIWGGVTYTTAGVAPGATQAQVQAALQAATGPGGVTLPPSCVLVGGGATLAAGMTVTFRNGLGGSYFQPLTANVSGLTGGSGYAWTASVTTRGGDFWATPEYLDGTDVPNASVLSFQLRGVTRGAPDHHMQGEVRTKWDASKAEQLLHCMIADAGTGLPNLASTSSQIAMVATDDLYVVDFQMVGDGPIAASATDYYTFALNQYRAGSLFGQVASAGGPSVAIASWQPVAMNAGSQTKPRVRKGDTLVITATKTGAPANYPRPTATIRFCRPGLWLP